MLSIIAAIFLPLSFFTGLLGINVGGIPGTNSGDGFWITVAILAGVLGVQLLIFRKRGVKAADYAACAVG